MKRLISLFLILFLFSVLTAQPLLVVSASELDFDPDRLQQVDNVINRAVAKQDIPGAVLLVTRNNKIAYHKAYGYRQLVPEEIKMEPGTFFDLASITKPIATATSAMILVEHGQLRLLDKVSDFFPGFKSWLDDSTGRSKPIRIIHLMTHTSGLPPYAPVKELKEKYGSPNPDLLLTYISTTKRHHAPGTYFKYSCLNFITLQRIIEKISGQSLKDFAEQNIFKPLQMANTVIKPDDDYAQHCAATELLPDDGLLTGVVHDPLARIMMGCVSGNAGLFSDAKDLAIFAAMMLNNGRWNGHQILSPATVKKMTTVPAGYEEFGRALGWDVSSAYSSNQGDLFSEKTFGHTGYTGTSLIIDPATKTSVIFLTNRVHPDDKGSVVRLRSLVANVIAGAIVK